MKLSQRIQELDSLISTCFEQLARSTINEARFKIFCDKYEAEQKELTKFVLETKADIQTAKQDAVDLKAFLENIRECTDIQKLTPTLVNTLINKIEIFNSVKGEDGKKHVPITIHFRSADIVTVPDEEEIIAAMGEIRNSPTKVRKQKENDATQTDCTVSYIELSFRASPKMGQSFLSVWESY